MGIVETILILHILGEILLHNLHTLIHRLGNVDMVCTGLRYHYHTHHGHTIHLHIALDVAGAQFCTAYVAESYDASVALLDYQIVELLGRMHQSERTDGQLHRVTLDTTRGKLHIL